MANVGNGGGSIPPGDGSPPRPPKDNHPTSPPKLEYTGRKTPPKTPDPFGNLSSVLAELEPAKRTPGLPALPDHNSDASRAPNIGPRKLLPTSTETTSESNPPRISALPQLMTQQPAHGRELIAPSATHVATHAAVTSIQTAAANNKNEASIPESDHNTNIESGRSDKPKRRFSIYIAETSRDPKKSSGEGDNNAKRQKPS